ncbi:hypothetical protein ABW21_db0209888 [Orbilia brochopaga]|nr:hypothetical protein ABW21_db0209888 [Drechslerella brochopaga]
MSDREFGGSDDLSLPKATVQKIISEILPSDLAFAKDARDLLIECCVEFITLISSEANEIAEKEAKKTIASEHVVKALNDLGFNEYIDDVQETAQEHKETQKVRAPPLPANQVETDRKTEDADTILYANNALSETNEPPEPRLLTQPFYPPPDHSPSILAPHQSTAETFSGQSFLDFLEDCGPLIEDSGPSVQDRGLTEYQQFTDEQYNESHCHSGV